MMDHKFKQNLQVLSFSLTEMLIVIAIMAILMALLVPSLNRALSIAEATHCMSNLKVVASTLHIYGDDHGGEIPINWPYFGYTSDPDHLPWGKFLFANEPTGGTPTVGSDYLSANDRRVLNCPSSKNADFTLDDDFNSIYGMTDTKKTDLDIEKSYPMPAGSLNVIIIQNFPDPSGWSLLLDSTRTKPEDLNLQLCKVSVRTIGSGTGYASWTHSGIYKAHREFCNSAFVDGSVRTLETEDDFLNLANVYKGERIGIRAFVTQDG